MKCFAAFLGMVCVFFVGAAHAATETKSLDFNDLDYDGGSILKIDGATIENRSGGDLFIYETDDFGMPAPGGFCALDENEVCKANTVIAFDTPVSNLVFSSFYVTEGDGAYFQAVIGTEIVRQFEVTSETTIDLSDIDGITLITLFDISGRSDKGIAYGAFSYTEYIAPIPLPAAMPLLFSALLLLGFGRGKSRLTQDI